MVEQTLCMWRILLLLYTVTLNINSPFSERVRTNQGSGIFLRVPHFLSIPYSVSLTSRIFQDCDILESQLDKI